MQPEQKQLRYRLPELSSKFEHLVVAESLRHGGVSPEPYASLNLSWYSPDDKKNIEKNRSLLFADFNLSEEEVAGSYQVHENKVQLIEQPGQSKGYDALITNKKGILLTIGVADCTPILIYDPVCKAVGGAHAGWRGTVAGVVGNTLQAMQEHFGTQPEDCFAYIGTCIAKEDYEVDNDVAQHFSDAFKRWDEAKQKFFIDLKEANKSQLEQMNVPTDQIEVSPFSTFQHNENYFSYRREKGKTGRALALIGIR